jgi:hypothetical protein
MRATHITEADHRSTNVPVATSATDPRVDQAMVTDAMRLRRRAASLRARAGSIDGPLNLSYRRRASELMLQAWLLDVRSGLPLTDIPTAA